MSLDVNLVNKLLANNSGGVRTIVDGIEFRSKLEAMWWTRLHELLPKWHVLYEPGTFAGKIRNGGLVFNYTPDFALLSPATEPPKRKSSRFYNLLRQRAVFVEAKPESLTNEQIPNNIWMAGDIVLIQGYPDSAPKIDVVMTGGSRAYWRWPRAICGEDLIGAVNYAAMTVGVGRAPFQELVKYD